MPVRRRLCLLRARQHVHARSCRLFTGARRGGRRNGPCRRRDASLREPRRSRAERRPRAARCHRARHRCGPRGEQRQWHGHWHGPVWRAPLRLLLHEQRRMPLAALRRSWRRKHVRRPLRLQSGVYAHRARLSLRHAERSMRARHAHAGVRSERSVRRRRETARFMLQRRHAAPFGHELPWRPLQRIRRPDALHLHERLQRRHRLRGRLRVPAGVAW